MTQELTKVQKKKADKIIKLMRDLYTEGISPVVVAAPNCSLRFMPKPKGDVSWQEFSNLLNSENNPVYEPEQYGLPIETYAL